jgi:hypothetical protein
VAQGVVVADLPQHPGVRTNRGYNRHRADKRQNSQAMHNVGRDHMLLKLARRRRDIKCIVLARNHVLAPLAVKPIKNVAYQ